jgi:hypothetical protein
MKQEIKAFTSLEASDEEEGEGMRRRKGAEGRRG